MACGSHGVFILLLTFATASWGQYFYNPPAAPISSCNRVYNTKNFAITTVNSDVSNSQLVECSFTVQKFQNDVCFLSLHFREFALRGSQSCEEEHLIVGDEKICGSFVGFRQFRFDKPDMVIKYRGPSNARLDLAFEQAVCQSFQENHVACDIVSRDFRTEITSPNHPNAYPSSIACQYTILPATRAVCQVSVFFEDFQIEDSPNCSKDRLLIGNEPFCGLLRGYRTHRNLTDNLVMRFVSDSTLNDYGFKIIVEQIPCNDPFRSVPGKNESETLYYPAPYSPEFPPFPPPQPGLGFPTYDCCQRTYNTPYMVITSPGFLENDNLEHNCLYTIYPATVGSCRLRFHFKHFWLGEEDVYYGCTNGFLEIDGRKFCGCKDGHVHVSTFAGDRKEIWYNFRGSGQRGFIIEVYQEECTGYGFERFPITRNVSAADPNTEIEVFLTNVTSEKSTSRFFVPNDSSRCYRWGLPDWVEQIKSFLLNGVVSATCPNSNFARPDGPNAFYPPPVLDQPTVFQPAIPQPVIPAPPQLPPVGIPALPQPPPSGISPLPARPVASRPSESSGYPASGAPNKFFLYPKPPNRCYVNPSIEGDIWSPNFGVGYVPLGRFCYRIQRIPGFCELQLIWTDFNIDWSYKCLKNYLLLDQTWRYCGQSLENQATVTRVRSDDFFYIDLVNTKGIFSRGFRAHFIQMPCPYQSPFGFLKAANTSQEAFAELPTSEPAAGYPPSKIESPEIEKVAHN